MRRTRLVGLAVGAPAVAGAVAAAVAAVALTAPRAGTVPPRSGTVQVLTVAAPGDHPAVHKAWVYRPGVPDSAAVPVLYFLHGLPGEYTDIAGIDGKRVLDRLIRTRQVRPFVLVVPDGNSSAAGDPEWADSPAGTRLETFVTTSLRRAVEGRYPRSRTARAIAGFSMGGYGAMNLALRNPDVYGCVGSIAGYFGTDDESGIFRGDRRLLAANSPDHHVAAARRLHVVLADGTQDANPVTRGETERFASLLRRAGVRPDVDIAPGTHSMAYLRSELPRALVLLLGPPSHV